MPGPAQPYVAGDEGGNTRLLAYRLGFLRAIELVAPHVVELLRADVMPAYRAAWEESQPFVQGHFWPRGWDGLTSVPDMLRGPRLPALLDVLHTWAAEHNLNEPWLLDAALDHMRYELALGEALPLGHAPGIATYWEPAQMIAPPEYRPQEQTRADYLTEVRRYMDDVEAEYARAGWNPADPPGEILKHLVWLARHQLGMTYEEVQNAAGVEDVHGDAPELSTVRRGVQRAAEAIGLTLRPAPRR